jgi:hypothetical protein
MLSFLTGGLASDAPATPTPDSEKKEPINRSANGNGMFGRDTIIENSNPLKAKKSSEAGTQVHVENLQDTQLITPGDLKQLIADLGDTE